MYLEDVFTRNYFSGTNMMRFKKTNAWMGALYYKNDQNLSVANTTIEGVYIYPDWKSCIKGSWRQHVLQNGVYCNVIESYLNPDGILSIMTQVDLKSPNLTYSPPNYHSFGVPPTQSDPFETNSVEVKMSGIEGSGDGLFAKQSIKRGEVICFVSGFFVANKMIQHPLDRRGRSESEELKEKIYTLTLLGHPLMKKLDVAVDLPPDFAPLEKYSATLGHKAQHSFRNNAIFNEFTAHPLLGYTMCLLAIKDIPAGSEVFVFYGYNDVAFYENYGIDVGVGEHECYKGHCQQVLGTKIL